MEALCFYLELQPGTFHYEGLVFIYLIVRKKESHFVSKFPSL